MIAEQSRTNDFVKVGLEAVLPFPQSSGVMRTDRDKGIEDEVAVASIGCTVDEGCDRGKDATGEDPFSNEVDSFVVGLGARFWHGDALENRNTSLTFQDAVDALEVGGEELDPYSFEHLDGTDSVESVDPAGRKIAVVHEVYFDLALHPGGSDALLCESFLFDGERDTVYGASGHSNCFHGERAPTCSDLEDAITWTDVGTFDDELQLGLLGCFQFVVLASAGSGAVAFGRWSGKITGPRTRVCCRVAAVDTVLSVGGSSESKRFKDTRGRAIVSIGGCT